VLSRGGRKEEGKAPRCRAYKTRLGRREGKIADVPHRFSKPSQKKNKESNPTAFRGFQQKKGGRIITLWGGVLKILAPPGEGAAFLGGGDKRKGGKTRQVQTEKGRGTSWTNDRYNREGKKGKKN